MKTLILLAAILQVVPGAQQPGGTQTVHGAIQGIVKAPNAPDGIPDAQITLIAVGIPGALANPSPQLIKTTDAGGRFSFNDVPEGRYSIRVQKEGYFAANMNGAAAAVAAVVGSITPVTITRDAHNPQVTIPLVPGGIISGLIRDPQGRPAAGVAVTLLRAGYQDGRRTFTTVNTGADLNPLTAAHTTNDRGEYRIFWVPPGEYFVRTDVPNVLANLLRNAPASNVPLLTFYPGTPDASRAVPISVAPGQEVAAIDFPIEYSPAYTLSGKVSIQVPGGGVTLPNGQVIRSVASFYIVRQDAEPGTQAPLTPNSKRVDPNAPPGQTEFEFELRGVTPGSYYVYPLFQSGLPAGGVRAGGGFYSARIPVDVFDKDVTGLSGVIHAYPDLTVQISLQGQSNPTSNPTSNPQRGQSPPAVRVQLRPQEALPVLLTAAVGLNQQMQPDGTITFPNIFPAKYKILIPQVPAGYYVADMRQGGVSMYNDALLNVSDNSQPVSITLSTGAGSIQGVVHDKQGQPVSGSIVLIPSVPRRHNSVLYKRAAANQTTGQFTLNGIAPGEYKIFAWETQPNGAEENEEFLAKYENRGQSITITGGNTANLTLDLIPAAR